MKLDNPVFIHHVLKMFPQQETGNPTERELKEAKERGELREEGTKLLLVLTHSKFLLMVPLIHHVNLNHVTAGFCYSHKCEDQS